MKGTMLIMRAGERQETKYYNRPPTPDELKTAIGGGYLEAVPLFNTIGISATGNSATVMDCVAFCDEHGKLHNAPINREATVVWEQAVRRCGLPMPLNDYLVGTVLVLFGDREFMSEL